jgi:general secretion pathway protein F
VSGTGKTNAGAVTFEQLIALNDEMAALVRAGIPLERGLAELGRDLPGRSGQLAEMLAGQMSAGESLPQILSSATNEFPPVWRAVVESGLRSGHLSAALESMSATARRMNELRKMVGAALLYPLLVVLLAYAMFVFLVTRVAPVESRVYQDLTRSSEPLLDGLVWLGQTALWWAPWLPLAILLLLTIWWHRSAQVAWSLDGKKWSQPSNLSPVLRWLSPRKALGRVFHDERMAGFAEVLSLLVNQQVPLGQAVVLAADASGDRLIRRASQEIADRLQRGEILTRREDLPAEFPPLLGWLLISGAQHVELSQALARIARNYRERAGRAAAWTTVYLPITLTVLIGGTATLVQGLVTFLPLWKLWYDLSQALS